MQEPTAFEFRRANQFPAGEMVIDMSGAFPVARKAVLTTKAAFGGNFDFDPQQPDPASNPTPQ